MGVGGQRHAVVSLLPVPIAYAAGWAAGAVWTGAKYLAATGIRSPDRQARCESLYRLSSPGPQMAGGLIAVPTYNRSEHYLSFLVLVGALVVYVALSVATTVPRRPRGAGTPPTFPHT
jgi:hypothetical protein